MKKILVIHGPNLNMLGTREPEVYGTTTLEDINLKLKGLAKQHGAEVETFQSNIEGEIVGRIQQAPGQGFEVIIINPAAYTHTSVAIRDAISAIGKIPVVEVHMSNIHAREDFRRRSFVAEVCRGQIAGFGAKSYELAFLAAMGL